MSDPTPLDTLFSAAQDLAGELTAVVPRLVRRSRDQLSALGALAEKLQCADLGGGGSDDSDPTGGATPERPVSPVANITSAPSAVAAAGQAPAKKAAARKSPARKTPAKKSPAKQAANTKSPARVAAAAEADLGIPSYDTLAASQVRPRLDGLTADELESIRLYELAGRSRRTILGRITQLQRD